MQTCSRCHTKSPDSAIRCVNCQAELKLYSESALALKRLQENPRVSHIRVAVNHDCCPACRQAEGAYSKENAPKIPIEGCSQNLECRCYYQPVLEELFP